MGILRKIKEIILSFTKKYSKEEDRALIAKKALMQIKEMGA